MPVETRVSEEFGKLVTGAMGSDSYGQGTIKTSISQAYLHAMKAGRVPGRAIVEKFATGYAVDPTPLLIAAGYERLPETSIESEGVKVFLRIEGPMTEDKRRRIEEYVREIIEEEDGE